jgi:hypothetical protein
MQMTSPAAGLLHGAKGLHTSFELSLVPLLLSENPQHTSCSLSTAGLHFVCAGGDHRLC